MKNYYKRQEGKKREKKKTEIERKIGRSLDLK